MKGNSQMSAVRGKMNAIKAKVANHSKLPSMAATEISRDPANPNQVYSITDTNKVLGNGKTGNTEGWVVKSTPAGAKEAKIVNNQLQFKLTGEEKYDGTTLTFQLEKQFYKEGSNQFYRSNSPRRQTIFWYGTPSTYTYTVKVTVKATGKMKIAKTDDQGNPVPGVTFRWGRSKDKLDQTTAATGSDGTVEIQTDVGTIYVQEDQVPSHLEKDETIKSVVLKAGQTSTVTFVNKRKTRPVTVQKQDYDTNQGLAGITFEYWSEENPDQKYTSTTGAGGSFESYVNFPVGTKVFMREVAALPGYELDETVYELVVSENAEENIFRIFNRKKSIPLQITKLNERTGKPVSGVTFRVGTAPDGTQWEEVTTNASGIAETQTTYKSGTYVYYQEISAPGRYEIDDTMYSVLVDGNQEIQKVTMKDEEKPLELRLVKKGEDGIPLSGVRFRLEKKVGDNWYTEASNLVTDRDGRLTIPGTYDRKLLEQRRLRLVEESTVHGYELPEEPIYLDPALADSEENVVEIEIKNHKLPALFSVYKYDSDTNKPLAGAVFLITDENGNKVLELTTGSDGKAETQELMANVTYYIEEIQAPRGYESMTGRVPFVIEEETAEGRFELHSEFPNKPIYGQIQLEKKDQNGRPLQGIEFTIYKNGTPVDTMITDSEGKASSGKLLADGTYLVRETYAPPQYEVENPEYRFDFTENPSGGTFGNWEMTFDQDTLTMTYRITDEEKLGSISIKKVDAEKREIPVKGAKFELRNRYTGALVESGTTDEDGLLTLENLPLVNPTVDPKQGYYYLEEVTPGENHILPEDTRQYISLTVSHMDYEVTFANPPVKGSVELKKVDAEDITKTIQGARFAIYEEGNLSQPVQEKETDEQGVIRFEDLRYGNYIIKETQAAPGYFHDPDKEYPVTISEHGKVIPVTVTNQRLQVQVEVKKYAMNEGGSPLAGVTFELRDGKDQVLDTFTTDYNGVGKSKPLDLTEFPEGCYVVETKGLPGYKPDDTHYHVSPDRNANIQLQLLSVTVVNQIDVPELKLLKVNEEGEPLQAQFTLEYGNRQGENTNYFLATNAEGICDLKERVEKCIQENPMSSEHYFKIVETKVDGEYQLGDGYIANFTVYRDSPGVVQGMTTGEGVTYDENTLTITAVNKRVKPAKLQLHKIGPDGEPLDATFEITCDKEPGKVITVETKAEDGGIALEEFLAFGDNPQTRNYQITEIKTGSNYELLSAPIPFTLYWTPNEGAKLEADEANTPAGAEVEVTENNTVLNVTVTNQKKDFQYYMKKAGEAGDDQATAHVKLFTTHMPADVYRYSLWSQETSITDFINFLDGLKLYDEFPVYLEEEDAGGKYEYQLFRGQIFTYCPNEEGLNKFQNVDPHVKIESAGDSFTITLTNERYPMELLFKKTDNTGNKALAGALFRVSTNRGYEAEYVTTGDPSGERITGIPYAEEVTLTEISPPPGYLLGETTQWTIRADQFEEKGAVYYCYYEFDLGTIKNSGEYGLKLLKKKGAWEEGGEAEQSNAVFEIRESQEIMKVWTVETEAGIADLAPILKEIVAKDRDGKKYDLTIKETETEAGAQLAAGTIAVVTFDVGKLRNNDPDYLSISSENADLVTDIQKDGMITYVTITNKPVQVSLNLIKKEAGQEKYLAGAEFTITPEGKDPIKVYTTGDPKGVTQALPWASSYTVQETHAPEGYLLDPTLYTYSIDDFTKTEEGGVLKACNLTVTCENTPVTGWIQVTKSDAEDGSRLAGAEFAIYKAGEAQPAGTITVDETGVGRSGLLPYGSYELQETKAPDGYEFLTERIPVKIEKEAQTVYIDVPNRRSSGQLTIRKQDEEGKALAGAVFTIHRQDTDEQVGGELTTGPDGTIGPVELPYGDYYIKEVRFPAGYVSATGKTYPFTLDGQHLMVEQVITNKKSNYSFRLYKRDSETGAGLANALFGVFRQGEKPGENEPLLTFRTNSQGVAVVMMETGGTYHIYELEAPEGYQLLQGYQEITVTDETPAVELTVENTRQNLTIEIVKQDKEGQKPLAGAIFEIRNGRTGQVVAVTDPTDGTGKVRVEVPAGDYGYTVTEIQAPEGYVLDTNSYPVEIDKETGEGGTVIYTAKPVVIENEKIRGSIKLVKTDDTGTKPLAGAVFEIRDAQNQLVDTLVTNSKGEAMSKNLAPGTYMVTETKAPEGYELSEKPYQAELTQDQTVVEIRAVNTPKKGAFSVKKVDAHDRTEVLKGAEFTAYASAQDAGAQQNPVQTAETDQSGIAEFKDLPYGIYYLRETKAPEGYELSDRIWTVTVDEKSKEAEPLVCEDYPRMTEGYFRLMKTDAETKEALSGAEFLVTGPDSYSKTYTTGADGTFTSDALKPGTYTVTETKAPEGYQIGDDPVQTVEVTEGSQPETLTVSMTNKKIQKQIQVVKTDDTGTKPLSGAVFEIYRLDEQDQPIEPAADRLITGSDGTAVSRMLPAGRYRIVEVRPPEGYEDSGAFQDVVIGAEGDVTITIRFQNTAILRPVKIKKIDARTQKPLSGVTFRITGEDGTEYQVTTGTDGWTKELNLPYGTYTVLEMKVPEGYEEGSLYKDTFQITRPDQEITLTAENQPVLGVLQLSKVDKETRANLAGAVYGIYTKLQEDGDVDLASHMAGYDMTTTEAAYVESKELPMGTYYVKEITPPAGYQVNDQVYTAQITGETPYIPITAEDEALTGSVQIYKKDQDRAPLKDAIFALYTAEDYEKIEQAEPDDYPDVPVTYLTTDEKGYARAEGLKLNQEYVLVEFQPPAGYEKPADQKPYRFTPAEEQLEFTYEAVNTKKKELVIYKKNEWGEPVSGVTFEICSYGPDGMPETADDTTVGQFSPEINGSGIARYDISSLANGWYYVKEVQASDVGYELSEEIIPFEITDTSESFSFDFVNYRPRGELEIQKVDEAGNDLPGAEFALYHPAGFGGNAEPTFYMDFEMDENGHGVLKDIPADAYLIRETKAPEGYKPIEDIYVDLYRDGEEQQQNGRTYYYCYEEISNAPITGQIQVQKAVENDTDVPAEGVRLQNARFEIRDAAGAVADVLVTDIQGQAVSRELPAGTYTIVETEAPDGTILNEQVGTVIIDGSQQDDIYTYTHTNRAVKGQISITKVDENGGTLAGAEFDLFTQSGVLADHLVIGEGGTAVSKELPFGWYTIRETKSPEGYLLDPNWSRKVQIREDQETVQITVENRKGEGPGLYVVKYDADDPAHYLKGAEFTVREANTGKVIGTYVTDEKGQLQVPAKDLTAGREYIVQETKAPEGYQLDSTEHRVTWGQDQSIALYLENEREKGFLHFEKTGEMVTKLEEDGTYPGLKKLIWEQKNLDGAVIGIYAGEEVTLDGRTYQKGELIQKLSSGEQSRALPYGTYQYKELEAPGSYVLDPAFHEIRVEKAHTEVTPQLITMENTHGTVQLELYKKFSDGTEKFDQVKFGIYTAEELHPNQVQIPKDTLLAVRGLDQNGKMTGEALKLPEGRYYVKELETAEGYLLDEEKHLFTVDYNNESQTVVIAPETDPIINEPLYGILSLKKTGELFTGVKKLVNVEGRYQVSQPIFSEGVLKGAEVEIRTTEDRIIDGTLYKKGEVVDVLISGEKDQSRRLPEGIYEAVEVKAPEGYQLDPTPKMVEVRADSENHTHTVIPLSFKNQKNTVSVSVYKNFFGKAPEESKDLFQEVLFGVYAGQRLQGSAEDVVIQKDELVAVLRLDETGAAHLADTMLPLGDYYLKELETADGYQISEKTWPFAVTADSQGEIVIDGISQEMPVINVPEGAEVPFSFRKVGEEGDPLSGAEFRLYRCENTDPGHTHSESAGEEGSCWKELPVISPRISGPDGVVDFGILPDGIYQLRESAAPEGYMLPAGQWRIRIDSKAEPGKQVVITAAGAAAPPAFAHAEEGAAYQYEVSNRRVRALPFTGGGGILAYAGGGGILLTLAHLAGRRKRKEEKEEA